MRGSAFSRPWAATGSALTLGATLGLLAQVSVSWPHLVRSERVMTPDPKQFMVSMRHETCGGEAVLRRCLQRSSKHYKHSLLPQYWMWLRSLFISKHERQKLKVKGYPPTSLHSSCKMLMESEWQKCSAALSIIQGLHYFFLNEISWLRFKYKHPSVPGQIVRIYHHAMWFSLIITDIKY